ncbi:MAG: hypothetical protein JW940_27345 [Polyangiaceae bacterium]|nr:hypothetical protein [Polyangiaceae bacterium]
MHGGTPPGEMDSLELMIAVVADYQSRLRSELVAAMVAEEKRLTEAIGARAARRAVLADLAFAYEAHQERARERNRAIERQKAKGRRR